MKKQNLVAISLFLAVIAVQIIGVRFFASYQKSKRDALFQNGASVTAEITDLRKYFPPKGPDQFGRVFYEFVVSDVSYKGDEWLSEKEFSQFLNTKQVDILYDPSKPSQSILKSKTVSNAEPTFNLYRK